MYYILIYYIVNDIYIVQCTISTYFIRTYRDDYI